MMQVFEDRPVIDRFNGEYDFLSNFYYSKFMFEGITYPTSEHAYQSLKTLIPAEQEMVRNAPSAGQAKRAGREVTMRPDWDEIKFQLMYDICLAKFTQNAYLRKRLLDTKDAELIEGNTWGDTYWGVCRGVGQNNLGIVLMQLRERFRLEEEFNVEWDND